MTGGSGLWTTAPHTQTTLRAGATTAWSRWGQEIDRNDPACVHLCLSRVSKLLDG